MPIFLRNNALMVFCFLCTLLFVACSSFNDYGNYNLNEVHTTYDTVKVHGVNCARTKFYTNDKNKLVFANLRCENGIWLDTSYYTNGNLRTFRFTNKAGGTAAYAYDSSFTDMYNRRGVPKYRVTTIYKKDTNYFYQQEYEKGELLPKKATVFMELELLDK